MSAPLDLNNEMILMRKELKRAKTWTITKLVRHMRNLRNKIGSEAQKLKNSNRADRLTAEIDIIKDMKPDDIFKTILGRNSTIQDLTKLDVILKERALVRIGNVSFIKKRMDGIRQNISSFHSAHSNKSMTTTLKMPEELKALPDYVDDIASCETGVSKGKSVAVQRDMDHVIQDEEGQDIECLERVDDICSEELTNTGNAEEQHLRLSESSDSGYNAAGNNQDDGFETISEPSTAVIVEEQPTNEEVVISTTDEGYQVVLPPYYSKQIRENKTLEVEQEDSSNFNSIAKTKGVSDVSDILPNIGDGFNSPEDVSDADDVEYEDLVVSGLERKEHTGIEKVEVDIDMFFVDTKGSTENRFRRSIKKTNVHCDATSDEETKKEIKSSFMGSLSKQQERGLTEKKNRPSQRARKKAHFKQDLGKDAKLSDRKKVRGKGKSVRGTERSSDPVDKRAASKDPEALHPSWEASRKRKQEQSTFKPFVGKRVCFSDSD